MMNSPGLAQLSADTSTFTSQVAATCSINDLDQTTQMNYSGSSNSLFGMDDFTITTNAPEVRLNVSSVTLITEPQPASGVSILVDADLHRSVSGRYVRQTGGNKSLSGTSAQLNLSQEPNFRMTSLVTTTDPINNVYQLPPGSYAYSVTLSCLL